MDGYTDPIRVDARDLCPGDIPICSAAGKGYSRPPALDARVPMLGYRVLRDPYSIELSLEGLSTGVVDGEVIDGETRFPMWARLKLDQPPVVNNYVTVDPPWGIKVVTSSGEVSADFDAAALFRRGRQPLVSRGVIGVAADLANLAAEDAEVQKGETEAAPGRISDETVEKVLDWYRSTSPPPVIFQTGWIKDERWDALLARSVAAEDEKGEPEDPEYDALVTGSNAADGLHGLLAELEEADPTVQGRRNVELPVRHGDEPCLVCSSVRALRRARDAVDLLDMIMNGYVEECGSLEMDNADLRERLEKADAWEWPAGPVVLRAPADVLERITVVSAPVGQEITVEAVPSGPRRRRWWRK